MGEGVIANYVSGLRYRTRNIGTLLDVASDHKEGCAHVVLRQDFEQV